MTIHVIPQLFDPLGPITFEEDVQDTNYGPRARRQNRIATLDGSSAVQDRGFSVSDLTFRISVQSFGPDTFQRLNRIIENVGQPLIVCREGVFYGLISNLNVTAGTFQFLVTRHG